MSKNYVLSRCLAHPSKIVCGCLACLSSKPCLAFTLRIIPYSPVVCKGGFQTFLFGHGDECCPRLSLLKRQVPNCSATPWLKSSIKAQALDPGLMTFSPQEDSQCSTLSLYFYILDWLFPSGKRPIGPKFNCQRSMSLSLDLGSQLDLACASSFSRSAFSRLNAAYYIIFVGRL